MGRQLNISTQDARSDTSYRYKMDPLQTKVEGRGNGIKTVLLNVAQVASDMRTDPKYITKFLGLECGAQSTWKEKRGVGIVNGSHQQADLQEKIYQFIQVLILCPSCDLPELKHRCRGSAVGAKCYSCGWVGGIQNDHAILKYVSRHPPKAGKQPKPAQIDQGGKKKRKKMPAAAGGAQVSDSPVKAKKKNEEPEQNFDGWHMDKNSERTEAKREEEEEDTKKLKENHVTDFPNSPVALLKFILQKPNMKLIDIVSEFQRIKIAHKLDEAETKLGKVLVDAVFDFSTVPLFLSSIEGAANFLSWYSADRETAKILVSYIEEAIVDKDFWEFTPMILEKLYDCNVFDENFLLDWYNQPPENSYVVQDPEEILKIKAKSEPFISWVKSVIKTPANDSGDDEEEVEETIDEETIVNTNESEI